MAVDLVSADLRMFDATGATVAVSNTAAAGLAAWNGYWVDVANAGGFTGMGGRNIRRVELDINVAEIPEPQSAALVVLALLAGAGFTRRKAAHA